MSQSARSNAVGIGVIGIGRRWTDHYRDALSRPGSRGRVVALCDPVAHRAEAEADRLGCEAAEGMTALIERPEVEVLFLLESPWFGLWPIRAALERGKAVFSAVGHRETLDELDRPGPLDSDPGPPVMIELLGRFAPEMLRLRELLATELGPARRVLLGTNAGRSSMTDAAIGLLDRCRSLLPGSDESESRLVRKRERPGSSTRVVSIAFHGGESARLSLVRRETPTGSVSDSIRLAVRTDRGTARIDRDGRLRWSIGDREFEEPVSGGSAVDSMVDQILRRVRGEQSLAPSLDDSRTLERSSHIFES